VLNINPTKFCDLKVRKLVKTFIVGSQNGDLHMRKAVSCTAFEFWMKFDLIPKSFLSKFLVLNFQVHSDMEQGNGYLELASSTTSLNASL